MWNKNKSLIEWLRERHREMRCEDLNRKLQPGMLTYLDDGTEIDALIISRRGTPKKEVSENDIAEAIRTISYGMGIPVGEIVLSLKRLQRDRVAEDIRNISLATGIPESEVEMQFLIPRLEKAAKGISSMAQSFADATKMLQAATPEYKNADDIIQNFGKDLGKGAEYILTKDMAKRLKEQFSKPAKVYFSTEPINIEPCPNEAFSEKQIFADISTKKSYTDTRMLYTGVELFRRHIEENTYTISRRCCFQARYDKQHEIANRNRHTSRHIPFYFKIFGKSRFVPRKNGGKDHTKFNRNVRPKGTHSHFKFYR